LLVEASQQTRQDLLLEVVAHFKGMAIAVKFRPRLSQPPAKLLERPVPRFVP